MSGGSVVALSGGLGAGKTLFAKGFARGLGVPDEVTSPTYTIVSEYEGRLRLHHVDAWRLADADEFLAIGGEDLLADPGGVALIEWSERIAELLPAHRITVLLEVLPEGGRLATLGGPLPPGAVPP